MPDWSWMPYVLVWAGAYWAIVPKFIKWCYNSLQQSQASTLPLTRVKEEHVSYEKSYICAVEACLKYLVTICSIIKVVEMVAEKFVHSYYTQVCVYALILFLVLLLNKWKSIWISRTIVGNSGAEREYYLELKNLFTITLVGISCISFVIVFTVPSGKLWAAGGIGGIVLAFVTKEFFGNIMGWLSVRVSQPFSHGEAIKVGDMEGAVKKMGVLTTTLLRADGQTTTVPNSIFCGQAITKRSGGEYHAKVSKIRIQTEHAETIKTITNKITEMLESSDKVYDNTHTYCVLSSIVGGHGELTLEYRLKEMSKKEMAVVEQQLLLDSIDIIKENGGKLA